MIPPVDALLEEFETLSLDERVYVVLRSDEDLEVSIHFQRKDAPKCWGIWFKLSEEASRQQCTRQTLPLVLRAFQVSEATFSKEIASRLLTQAAYADEFVRNVSDLLGADAVRESIRSTQMFMENLREMVRKTLGPSPAEEERSTNGPGLNMGSTGKVRGPVSLNALNADAKSESSSGGHSGSSGKGHLRILRSVERPKARGDDDESS
ncbi:MAG: hypothetical protein IOD12_16855 [Silvanigrellales bacterium]|nr:hypothetical protein [Silvanigrellales bacterium]